jgi:predicted amino acid-binding ACT domain protein
MKKKSINFVLLSRIFTLLFLVSCEKDEQSINSVHNFDETENILRMAHLSRNLII